MTTEFYQKSNVKNEFEITEDSEELVPFLMGKGYTVYSIEQKSRQLVPYHTHPSEEMVIVLEGSIRYIVEEEIVDIKKGDMIRISAGSVHAMVGISENETSKLLLTFI